MLASAAAAVIGTSIHGFSANVRQHTSASRVAPALRFQEIESARQRNTRDLVMWDLCLRWWHHYYRRSREDVTAMQALCEQMLARDETFAPGHYFAAYLVFFGVLQGFVKGSADLWRDTLHHAERGVALAANDCFAQAILANVYAITGRHREALQHAREAVRINRYIPTTHGVLGFALVTNGDHAEALPSLETAWRLGSNDLDRYHAAVSLSFACYLLGRYEAALSWAEQCLKVWPDHLQAIGCRAAALAQLSRLDEARTALQRFLARLPGVTAAHHLRNFSWRRMEDIAHYRDGLIKAGLPE